METLPSASPLSVPFRDVVGTGEIAQRRAFDEERLRVVLAAEELDVAEPHVQPIVHFADLARLRRKTKAERARTRGMHATPDCGQWLTSFSLCHNEQSGAAVKALSRPDVAYLISLARFVCVARE